MKRAILALVAAATLLGLAQKVEAGNTASQTVTFEVQAINELSVSGNPADLIVNSATAGSQPNAVTNALTSYSVTTNQEDKKITGAIDSDMPANTTLTISLVGMGNPEGAKALSTVAADLVTNIDTVADGVGNTITYSFSATAAAGVVISDTRTVTLTLSDP